LSAAQIGYWEAVLRKATAQSVWQEELLRLSWSPLYQDGAALHAFLATERREFVATLGELGLLKR
jgi:tripartite-type tricarboxylate transporter receptor subunit TctC